MPQDLNDWAIAIHGLVGAQTAILRELTRHLVEEGYIPPSKAARAYLDAAAHDLPPQGSTGETYDAARDELIAIGTALLGWPETGRAPPVRSPRPDLG